MSLNDENYYSEEMNLKYLSAHSFMDYLKDKGVFYMKYHNMLQSEETEELIAGRLFHAFMESEKAFKEVLNQNADNIFMPRKSKLTKDRTVMMVIFEEDNPESLVTKAKFTDIWNFIISMWNVRYEKIWIDVPNWNKEVTLTGEINGIPFKGKIDALYVDKETNTAIVYDHKTLSLKQNYGYWYEYTGNMTIRHEKTFVEEYDYDLQMVVYKELVSQNFDIPYENIQVQFGVLVKSGKTQFVRYNERYLVSDFVKPEQLNQRRFETENDVLTARELLYEKAQEAYQILHESNDFLFEHQNAVVQTEIGYENSYLDVSKFKI